MCDQVPRCDHLWSAGAEQLLEWHPYQIVATELVSERQVLASVVYNRRKFLECSMTCLQSMNHFSK